MFAWTSTSIIFWYQADIFQPISVVSANGFLDVQNCRWIIKVHDCSLKKLNEQKVSLQNISPIRILWILVYWRNTKKRIWNNAGESAKDGAIVRHTISLFAKSFDAKMTRRIEFFKGRRFLCREANSFVRFNAFSSADAFLDVEMCQLVLVNVWAELTSYLSSDSSQVLS